MNTRVRNSVGRLVLMTAVTACAAPALAAAPNTPPAAPPAILSHIPGDATAAFVVGNLKTFGTQISNLGTRLNITQRFGMPLPPDLVGFAARNLGITKGLDPTGSAAIVLLHMQPEEIQQIAQTGPKMVFLVPTTDATGMLSDFSPTAKDADGIEGITLPTMPDRKTYAATVADKWVAFAHDHDLLQSYVKGDTGSAGLDKTVGGLGSTGTGAAALQVFSGNDAVLWLNIPDLQPVVDPFLGMIQERISETFDLANMSANNPAITAAFQKHLFGVYIDAFRAEFRDAQGSLTTLHLSDAGVTLGQNTVLKDGSALGKIVAAQSAVAQDSAHPLTLSGLPGGGFLGAGAARFDSSVLAPLFADFEKSVMDDDIIAKDPHAEQIRHLLDAYQQLVTLQKGVKMVILDPPVGGNKGAFNGAMLIDSSDPAKCIDVMVDLYTGKDVAEVVKLLSPALEMEPTVVRDAVTIKGIKLTKIQATYKLAAATPDHPLPPGAQEGLDIINKMYGPDGFVMYAGVVPGKNGGPGRILSVFGSEGPVLEGAVAAALADSDDLDAMPMVAAEKREIPSHAIAVVYGPLSKWMALIGNLATAQIQTTGEAAPGWMRMMSQMKEAPPLMVTIEANGTMGSSHLHVPVGAITSVLDVVGKARAEGRGAGAGGGAGNGMP